MDFQPPHENSHQLLDFGAGRRWERFGPVLVDRPSPAAVDILPVLPQNTGLFTAQTGSQVVARYQARALGSSDLGEWSFSAAMPTAWQMAWPLNALENLDAPPLQFELRPTPAGQIGIFPEQAPQWNWLAEQIGTASRQTASPLKILNLFAYTGGSTLAMAATARAMHREVEIVHLDAARNAVQWARHNGALSQLVDAPIRWIVEDARKFVHREAKRGNRYDAIILDPPSYGHGPTGEAWKIDGDLLPLLQTCGELLSDQPAFMLLTCHSPGYGPRELRNALQTAGCAPHARIMECGPMELATQDNRRLPAGFFARWS